MGSLHESEKQDAPICSKAYAMLPIYCEVLASRPDGFHKIQCILQQLSVYDTVTVKLTKHHTVTVKHPSPEFKTDYVIRIVKSFLDRIDADFGVEISIQPSIPVNGGLFEKESITAVALRLINNKASEPLSRIMLLEFANSISNELLFCSVNGTKYVDTLDSDNCMITSLPSLSECTILHLSMRSVKPIAPKEAVEIADKYYGAYWLKHREHPSQRKMFTALKDRDDPSVLEEVYNIYTKPLSERFPCIEKMSSLLAKLGAVKTCTAGCSNSVVGFFRDTDTAKHALSRIDPSLYKAVITETV